MPGWTIQRFSRSHDREAFECAGGDIMIHATANRYRVQKLRRHGHRTLASFIENLKVVRREPPHWTTGAVSDDDIELHEEDTAAEHWLLGRRR